MGRDRDSGVKWGGIAGLRRKKDGKAGFENFYCGSSELIAAVSRPTFSTREMQSGSLLLLRLPPQLGQNEKEICTWAPQQEQNMLSSVELKYSRRPIDLQGKWQEQNAPTEQQKSAGKPCNQALRNTFVHWEIDLYTEKYICALRNRFVHWKIYLCTEKYICALRNIFVHSEIHLCTE